MTHLLSDREIHFIECSMALARIKNREIDDNRAEYRSELYELRKNADDAMAELAKLRVAYDSLARALMELHAADCRRRRKPVTMHPAIERITSHSPSKIKGAVNA